jgi:response regulator RpfG family c-di-GMP phosphodiesterase
MSDFADELLFAEEEESGAPPQPSVQDAGWRVLIVDDEPAIHDITRLALRGIHFDGHGLTLLHAYSAREARTLLANESQIALILLDVVMEDEHAGLDLVRHIREKLGNTLVRIILRTGQPGQAPEREVIQNYDINDYKEKTELTADKLFTVVISALRAYRDLARIERNRQGLEKIVEASSHLFSQSSLERFFVGVLEQMLALINVESDALFALNLDLARKRAASRSLEGLRVMAGTGSHASQLGAPVSTVLPGAILQQLETAQQDRCNVYEDDHSILYIRDHSLIFIDGVAHIDEIQRTLLSIFCRNVSIAFENLLLDEEVLDTQKEIAFLLGTTAEFRCKQTGNHVRRVAEYSYLLAKLMGYPESEAELLRLAAPLHDLGKLGIPDNILLKSSGLSNAEFEVIKSHTTIGYEMLKASERPLMKTAAILAHEHQERWDGSGYPRGLKGEAIHPYGRLLSVVDVFDALISERHYKQAWPRERVIAYFEEQCGGHFDPVVTRHFLDHIDQFYALYAQHLDLESER